jgi:hypothetical protein
LAPPARVQPEAFNFIILLDALEFGQTLWWRPIERIEHENALLSSNWFLAGGSTLLSMERDIGSIHGALAKRRGARQ